MRVLVEQTKDNAVKWLKALGMYAEAPRVDDSIDGWAKDHDQSDLGKRIGVTVLMGGENKDNWDLYPERDAIIIGTQDMLLSRALNRGYGMSRYRWPVHFGLLNNDCLWVMDEVQLMGVGVETSAQLQGFCDYFGTFQNAQHIWMSATLDGERLDTVDHPKPSIGRSRLSLSEEDVALQQVSDKFEARKNLKKAPLRLEKDNEKSYPEEMANLIIESHAKGTKGTLTLVVVNRVSRAQMIYKKLISKGRTPENTAVLHSRFRAGDRKDRMKLLDEKKDRIVVSTQVVEAGVDVSAHTMITELAPWSSLVQRFGRCNRRGEYEDALVEWVDLDFSEDGTVLPYDSSSLAEARDLIEDIDDAGPKSLSTIIYEEPGKIRPVVRRKDLLDLFDTTPDLTGNDLDISRYIREDEDRDVQVYWREVEDSGPKGKLKAPKREELCSVSISQISQYLKKNPGWIWDPLDSAWQKVGNGKIRPGQVILLNPRNGGYTPDLGWVGTKGKEPVDVVVIDSNEIHDPSMDGDPRSQIGKWISLQKHTEDVSMELMSSLEQLDLPEEIKDALNNAARWHDLGKLHPAFQNMLLSDREDEEYLRVSGPWAKSDKNKPKPVYWVNVDGKRVPRPYFRHELASALAWLQTEGETEGDLVAYLMAAHHGKVRMSIRSLPKEAEPQDRRLFARGIWDGDLLPRFPPLLEEDVKLDLSLMQIGDGSWLERTLHLRDNSEMGPFRLAYLEALLRSADWRASGKEAREI